MTRMGPDITFEAVNGECAERIARSLASARGVAVCARIGECHAQCLRIVAGYRPEPNEAAVHAAVTVGCADQPALSASIECLKIPLAFIRETPESAAAADLAWEDL